VFREKDKVIKTKTSERIGTIECDARAAFV